LRTHFILSLKNKCIIKMSECNNYVHSGNPLGPGHTGYIGNCGDGCMFGYTSVGTCNGPGYISCLDACGQNADMPSCAGIGNTRPICKRNYNNYAPVAQNTLESKCCPYNSDNPILITNDCPPGASQGSDICSGVLYDRCTANTDSIIGPGCDTLASSHDPIIEAKYNSLMQQRCTASIDNLNESTCTNWCIKNSDLCDTNVLLGFCKDKMNQEQYYGLCGCFYPQSVYDGVREKLATEFSIPQELLSGGRQCFFPLCASAKISYGSTSSCKDVNLVKCINEVDITNNGTIGTIALSQDALCSSYNQPAQRKCEDAACGTYVCNTSTDACYTTCTTDAQCSNGSGCINGRCTVKPNTCNPALCGGFNCNPAGTACLTTCTSNGDCTGGNVCNAGRCGSSPPPPVGGLSTSTWIYIGIGIAVFLIIIGVIIFFVVRGRKKSAAQNMYQQSYPQGYQQMYPQQGYQQMYPQQGYSQQQVYG
jgi:hypothetical protein